MKRITCCGLGEGRQAGREKRIPVVFAFSYQQKTYSFKTYTYLPTGKELPASDKGSSPQNTRRGRGCGVKEVELERSRKGETFREGKGQDTGGLSYCQK